MQQKPWAAGQEGSLCYFEPLSQTEVHPGKVPYCSVLLRMTCLNSRKLSGFHLKKAVSICHKSPSNAAPLRNGKFTPGCTGAIFSTFQLFPFQMCHCWSVLTCPSTDATHKVSQASLPNEGSCCDSLGQLEGLPPARLPAQGQGRAPLLPRRAVTQLHVSDSHLFFT